MKCKIIDCDHPVKYTGKQLCGMHYQQIYHHGKIIVKSPRLCSVEGCKGVRWRDRENKFISIISVSKKSIVLGYFDNPIEAAKAYDQAAIMHFGEFARTNKMEGRL